ncbi:hypothetical protein F4818DRAFT_249276 [Hypoxylon cercidicola]|nr:hypothetical protein F4818DRAFT_249276 [Hypoxylon cercidicola]
MSCLIYLFCGFLHAVERVRRTYLTACLEIFAESRLSERLEPLGDSSTTSTTRGPRTETSCVNNHGWNGSAYVDDSPSGEAHRVKSLVTIDKFHPSMREIRPDLVGPRKVAQNHRIEFPQSFNNDNCTDRLLSLGTLYPSKPSRCSPTFGLAR